MKRGFLGPYGQGFLAGAVDRFVRDAADEGIKLDVISVADSAFFGSAFQAGIDRFIFHKHRQDEKNSSKFVRERTEFVPISCRSKHSKIISELFDGALPLGWRDRRVYRDATYLEYFLGDLFDSMDAKASLLSPSGVPDIEDFRPIIPAHLYIPLKNLFDAIKPLTGSALVPQCTWQSEDLTRFRHLVESDIFERYSSAHALLDDGQTISSVAIKQITARARDVAFRNMGILDIKSASIGLLKFAPKLIDVVAGKLPGAISELFAGYANSYLENRQRVVIYDFNPQIRQLNAGLSGRLLAARQAKSKA